jgi:hypothetical protein
MDVNATSATVNNLVSGQVYAFTVSSVRGSKVSSLVSVQSTPSARYTTDVSTGTPLRIYEKASTHGSGLTIDPSKGGPKNVSKNQSATPQNVQLAMVADNTKGTLVIGPANAFTEFIQVGQYDPDITISQMTYVAPSLDSWYYSGSMENEMLPVNNGNVSAYELSQSIPGTNGQGFFVRTGPSGNYHYARVFVKNVGGKLLQGVAPERYVELEITYQTTPNVPYAKTTGGQAPIPGAAARRMR